EAGRLKAHTDAEGHTTEYQYGLDGLPTQRTNALGHTFGYHYDPARRLTALTNENGARYRFAYDALDRLVAESGFDHKLTAYHYNQSGELVQQSEYGSQTAAAKLMAQYGGRPAKSKDRTPLSDGLKDQTPLRITEFKRDILGRLKHTVAHDNKGNIQETVYGYDDNGNLVRAANRHGITCFDYNPNGQLIGQHHWKVPTQEENEANGLPETDWRDPQYDMLYLPQTESIRYHYDFNGNRTATVLADGRQINHLYYGSGHLHSILFDGGTVTDIERDKLHREIQRTQGKLTSRYELDPVGRLKKQIAQLEALTEAKGKAKAAAGQTAVSRSYGYDKTGNLTHSTDQRTGTIHFEYDKIGRITQAGNERFAFDPAHNILSDGHSGAVTDNRIREYNGTSYYHDEFGNLIHRELPDGEVQNYFYDLHDQLVKVEIFKKDGTKETWLYTYDALGRRIGKYRETSDGLKAEEREFIWDGSHLLQEVYANGRYTYIYTDVDSYEPLAQIHNYTNAENETYQEINYFHCDQIGIPREMTDKDGKLLWFGDYFGWGKLKSEINVTETAHQPFRLQNQYFDQETGLHYNFFRYYEPEAGRFVNQDPIGLWGGDNLYLFSPNIQGWIDPLGLSSWSSSRREFWKAEAKKERERIADEKAKNPGSSPKCRYSERNLKRMEEGKAPRIRVRIRTKRGIEERNVSLELHHTYLPQRLGSNKAHESWNLSIVTPWGHAAMDPFRHTGSVLLKILKGTSSW
ncbi:RHS repeat-associated core domain-containing protein, partial [Neisseria sp.]|uniref:RHS repeat-associated core domain-containing protein n=1 Tax=Neisseria sp. TaxID=192066 RepID=UPI0026DBECBC